MSARSPDRPVRIAANVLLLGIVLSVAGSIAAVPVGSVGTADRTIWVLIHLMLVVGAAAILLGLPAIYVRQASSTGLLGLVGFGLLFIGFLGIGFFVPAVQTFLLPWVYERASCTLGCHLLSITDGPPLYGWFFLVEGLTTFVGLILFGMATARAAVLPRGAGYLMAVAGVLAVPVVIFKTSQVVALVPQILGFLAVVWIAIVLLTENRDTSVPVRPAAATPR